MYAVGEWSHNCVCLCMSERVSEKWLLALLITHRWVFTIRKGELERKWWTPCVVDESAPEVTVYRHTVSAVVFQAEKKEVILPSHIPLPSSCLTDYTSASDFLISCWMCLPVSLSVHVFVSAWQDLGVCPRLQKSNLSSTQELLHFIITHAGEHAIVFITRH